jgi:uncharacterized coiled-coil protein SlyX
MDERKIEFDPNSPESVKSALVHLFEIEVAHHEKIIHELEAGNVQISAEIQTQIDLWRKKVSQARQSLESIDPKDLPSEELSEQLEETRFDDVLVKLSQLHFDYVHKDKETPKGPE